MERLTEANSQMCLVYNHRYIAWDNIFSTHNGGFDFHLLGETESWIIRKHLYEIIFATSNDIET